MSLTPALPVSSLYTGEVIHRRLAPKKHFLKYRIFSLLIDLDELTELDHSLLIFSLDKFNLISLHQKDYGDETSSIKSNICQLLITSGLEEATYKIYLQTMPRILGYVFNPLSVFFCFNKDHKLAAIVYEVSNTFSQKHRYVFNISKNASKVFHHSCQKSFYVSPFLEMDLSYHFLIKPPQQTYSLSIRVSKGNQNILTATQHLKSKPLNNNNLILAFLTYPLLTFKVIIAIHYEALKLWLKGVRIFPRNQLSKNPIGFSLNDK